VLDAARQRFGCGPALQSFNAPGAALERAGQSCDVAILSLAGDWWTDLPEQWPQLSAFAILRTPGGSPCAVALARVEPGALAGGAPVTVGQGPGSDGACEVLATCEDVRLAVEPPGASPAGRVVGAACGWTGPLSNGEARA
jgi:hypothetical protein